MAFSLNWQSSRISNDVRSKKNKKEKAAKAETTTTTIRASTATHGTLIFDTIVRFEHLKYILVIRTSNKKHSR